MPEEFPQQDAQSMPQDPTTALLSEFGTRLTEIEEKQRLIKDRLLLIGENLISTKEDIEKQNLEFKTKIKQTEFEIKTLKQITKRVVSELGNLARKPELEILQRQMKMFQPLEFARIQDIKSIVSDEIKKGKIERKKP
jgi:hypothetical protein